MVTVDVDGCAQSVLVRAERKGLPPLLVVQAGPGLPLHHEADRFRAVLNFEQVFEVRYWDQRGCGPVDKREAYGVSLQRQVDDLRCMLRTIHAAERSPVTVLGISLGATYALLAAEREPDTVGAIIAISAELMRARATPLSLSSSTRRQRCVRIRASQLAWRSWAVRRTRRPRCSNCVPG